MKLKLRVYDEKNNMIFCKIELWTNFHSTSGDKATVYCKGEYEFELGPGEYGIEIYKGNLYEPVKKKVRIDNQDVALTVSLKELIDTRSHGLYSFDAHSHVSRKESSNSANLEIASTIMKGEDFNFFFAGSPYDQETHLQEQNGSYDERISYRDKFSDIIGTVSDNRFILDIGNEIVKVRYGHMFLMNYEQMPPFSKYYDREWDPWLFTKIGEEPKYSIPYPYEALRQARGSNSVAVAAHPTSWWHHNGEFITNIAATLGFEILAGSIDAMVIMGYDRDHIHYQKLWYEALNQGYFMPGVAEMDLTFDSSSRKHLAFKTYAYADEFSIDALCTSVKEGKNLVSSGPILLLQVNGQTPGAVLNYQADEEFIVRLQAFRCHRAALSRIQLIVGGEVWKEYEIDQDRYELKETLKVSRDTYIVAKCYDFDGNVAIANPVYIRNAPFENRDFKSDLTVRVMKEGRPADGIYWIGEHSDKSAFTQEIRCRINVASEVKVEVAGNVKTIKLFEIDELQKMFKHLYFGYFNLDNRHAPGEVPAACFEFPRIRKILSKVDLQLHF